MPWDADGFPIYHLSITRRFNGREKGGVKEGDVNNSEVEGEVRIKGRKCNTKCQETGSGMGLAF